MDSSIEQRLAEFSAFETAMREQMGHDSELAQVLIIATFLDKQLRAILEAFLVEERSSAKRLASLFEGPSAPMGAFSSRIKMAFALGLIDEREHRSIDAIRDIRNAFAHELTIKFSDESLTGKFDKLAWAALRDTAGTVSRSVILFLASLRLASGFTNRADQVALERRTGKEWPNARVDAIDDQDFDLLDRYVRDLDGSWGEFYARPTGFTE